MKKFTFSQEDIIKSRETYITPSVIKHWSTFPTPKVKLWNRNMLIAIKFNFIGKPILKYSK